MTFREKLSGILKAVGVDIERDLLHFRSVRIGGASVKQKGRINIAVVAPEGTEALAKKGGLAKAIVRTKGELTALSRLDLAGYDILTLIAQAKDRDLITMCKKVLGDADLQALSIAMTIRRYEMSGNPDYALKLRRKLRSKYGERGNRIYNFYTSSMMKEFLLPVLIWVELTPTLTDIERAKKVFERCIEHMEHAIYVNYPMARKAVVDEIRYRFLVDRVKVVLVFGRTESIIRKVKAAVDEFCRSEAERQIEKREYEVREERYRWGKAEAITVIIAKK